MLPLDYRGMLLVPLPINKIIMKKIYYILFLVAIFAACKSTFSFAMNPDKGSFTSGTIGSAGFTNSVSGTNMATVNYSDTSFLKRDTLHREFRMAN